MAKYEFIIEIKAPEGSNADDPTLEEVARAVDRGVRDAFPDRGPAEVKVNAGNRPDRD